MSESIGVKIKELEFVHENKDVNDNHDTQNQIKYQTIIDDFGYAYRYVNALAVGSLSKSTWVNLQNLPMKWMLRAAFISNSVYWIIFIYFAFQSISIKRVESNVSLSYNPDLCIPSLATLDFTIFAGIGDGTRGIWSSLPNYEINKTAYKFQFIGFQASELQFIELMNHFDKKISITSEIGKNRGLLWNLIAWSTYFHRPTSLSSEINGVATFSLLGNIQTIMDKENYYVAITSKAGMCGNTFLPVSYYYADYQIEIDTTLIIDNSSNHICKDHIIPKSFGYKKDHYFSNSWSLFFDLRSMITALSVNMAINNINDLQITVNSRNNYIGSFPKDYCNSNATACSGLNVSNIALYVKSNMYNGMKKLYCITWTDGKDRVDFENNIVPLASTCFYMMGKMLLVPSFNIWDADKCNCSAVNYNEETCNNHDWLLSFFYFVDETSKYFPKTLEFVARAAKLVGDSKVNDEYINSFTYNAAFQSHGGLDYDGFPDSKNISDAYDSMCQDLGCAMIVFNIFEANNEDLNEFGLNFPSVACNSSFYSPDTFEELIEDQHKAFRLQNSYYSCKVSPFEIATYAIGTSTGNAQVGCICVMFIVFFCLGQYLRKRYNYRTGYGDLESHLEEKSKRFETHRNLDTGTTKMSFRNSDSEQLNNNEFVDIIKQLESKLANIQSKYEKDRQILQSENDRQRRIISYICDNVTGSNGLELKEHAEIKNLFKDLNPRVYHTKDEKIQLKDYLETYLNFSQK